MTETRYWKRVGLRLEESLAYEMEERMNAKGSFLDAELEEFTAIDAEGSSFTGEIKRLFASPDEFVESGDPVNGSAAVIDISYHHYNKHRKPRLLELRAEMKVRYAEERDQHISQMIEDSEVELSLEDAETLWDNDLPQRITTESNEVFQTEFDAFVKDLQEEYGVATN
tara:strand:+ start:122 stop:628 length:507 start_codon:yes stop_codon:yes gene_type:complete